MKNEPLVSVVTPVYNGERFLAECIESVLAQDYGNWEYVIANNCSTDRTSEIADRYSAKDSRIRLVNDEEFLPLIANWNRALRHIDAGSRYCKVVHADDLLLEGCLRKMVEVAEAHSSVGIIGAYRIDGDRVNLDAIPYPRSMMNGREVCRRRLLGKPDVFGSPTSLLIRSDLISSRQSFYEETELHADTAVCFDLLEQADFGFVHQVLTYTRLHEEAVTSGARAMGTQKASQFTRLLKYGPRYLERQEFRRRYRVLSRRYYRMLALKLLYGLFDREVRKGSKKFWAYHRSALAQHGHRLSRVKVLGSAAALLYNKMLAMLTL